MNAEEKLTRSIRAVLERKRIKIDKFLINYVVSGSGPNLLLLHGVNIGWGQWYPNIAELTKHFTVYALDLPGAGRSTKVDFRSVDLERDFINIVDKFIQQKKLNKVHLLGHSLGGWILLKIALKQKALIDKIVLVSPLGFTDYMPWKYRLLAFYHIANLLSRTVVKPTRMNMRKFLESVLHDPSVLDERFVDYFHESIHKEGIAHPLLLIHRLSGLFKMQKELLLIDKLSSITHPTLIIVGEKDPLIPFAKVSAASTLIPGARLKIFLNTGHVPSIEKSNEFNELVVKFLSP